MGYVKQEQCAGKVECHILCVYGLDCKGTCNFNLQFILFYLFTYYLRLLACGITIPLQCCHKPTMVGTRSSAMVQAQQALGC
jgi:hypothetical protein